MSKTSTKNSVAASSAKMATATFLSRILGLVREQVLAFLFGATGVTDAFLVAYRIPNMLRDLFAEGAFSSAFVPTFTKVKIESEERARELLWAAFILLATVTGIISLLIIIFAENVVTLMAPEFVNQPEQFALTVTLTKIMAPFLTLTSLAALFMGVLNSLKIFFVPALAPAFFNVVMIASLLILPGILKPLGTHPALAIGIGVIVGGFAQMLIQVPLIISRHYGFILPKKIITKETLTILNRMGIGVIGIAATEINLLVNTILATSTVVGAVSWLTFAFRLFQFPVGILGVSVGGSNLVHFSDAWKKDDKQSARDCLVSSYNLSIFTMFPAMAIMIALALPSTELVFQRGLFNSFDTKQTALALTCYLLGLPAYGLYKLFAPTFYVLDCPKIPVFTSIGTIALNIIFCVLLVPHYGFAVLALGTTLSMILNAFIQGYFISKMVQIGWSDFFGKKFLKVILGASVLYFGIYFSLPIFYHDHLQLIALISLLLSMTLAGVLAYIFILTLLGEGYLLNGVVDKIRRRLKK